VSHSPGSPSSDDDVIKLFHSPLSLSIS